MLSGITQVMPNRIPRGEPPYNHEQCKRAIRQHVNTVLLWSKSLPEPNSKSSRQVVSEVKIQAEADILALALETIACLVLNEDGGGPTTAQSATERHQDLLLARYVLQQSRRLFR